MKQKLAIGLLGLVVLATVSPVLAESKTFTATATLVIPAALEVLLDNDSLNLDVAPGAAATATTELSVGTNDWPLKLYANLLSPASSAALNFEYRLEAEQGGSATPVWIKIPTCSLAPVMELPSPAWTDYTLAIRVTARENAMAGEYLQILRLIFHSSSGLVKMLNIPIRVTGPPSKGQGGAAYIPTGQQSGPPPTTTSLPPFGTQVLIVTWEGVTQVSWDCHPGGDESSK